MTKRATRYALGYTRLGLRNSYSKPSPKQGKSKAPAKPGAFFLFTPTTFVFKLLVTEMGQQMVK